MRLVEPSVWITVVVRSPVPFKFWLKMGSNVSSVALFPDTAPTRVRDVIAVILLVLQIVYSLAPVNLPGNVIPGRRLHRTDRRPAAKLAGDKIRVLVLQRRAEAAAIMR